MLLVSVLATLWFLCLFNGGINNSPKGGEKQNTFNIYDQSGYMRTTGNTWYDLLRVCHLCLYCYCFDSYSRLASMWITQLGHKSFHSLLEIYNKISETLKSGGCVPSNPQTFNPTRLCHSVFIDVIWDDKMKKKFNAVTVQYYLSMGFVWFEDGVNRFIQVKHGIWFCFINLEYSTTHPVRSL